MVVSVLAAVAVVAVIILIVVGIKAEPEKGGEDMIKNVYIYLVLFATLMMTIGGSVAIFMAAADMISPTPYYQSFEDYRRYGIEKIEGPAGTLQDSKNLSDEELLVKYKAMVAAEKDRQSQIAKNNMIKSFGWIVIPLPVFIYFQRRLAKK